MTLTSPDTFRAGLTWGIKRRFVDYVGGLPDGQFMVSGGASTDSNHIFWFPLESIDDFDPLTGLGVVRFGGRAELSGHFGMMSLAVDRPWLEFSATGAELTIRDVERESGHRVPLLQLEIGAEPGSGFPVALGGRAGHANRRGHRRLQRPVPPWRVDGSGVLAAF